MPCSSANAPCSDLKGLWRRLAGLSMQRTHGGGKIFDMIAAGTLRYPAENSRVASGRARSAYRSPPPGRGVRGLGKSCSPNDNSAGHRLDVKSHGAVYLHHRRRGFLAWQGSGFRGARRASAGARLHRSFAQARSLSQRRSRHDDPVPSTARSLSPTTAPRPTSISVITSASPAAAPTGQDKVTTGRIYRR